MAERRRGLGRGLGALIPPAEPGAPRPVDVFFADSREDAEAGPGEAHAGAGTGADAGAGPGAGDGAGPDSGAGSGSGAVDVIDVRQPPVPARREPSAQERPTGLVPVPGVRFLDLPVGQVVPNPRQPRQVFDDDSLTELVQSVREIGILQPVVVRPAGQDADGGARYELVMGERRWRASEAAGLATVPAIVRDTPDDDLLRDALLENLHRSDLNPLEEAAAYQQLLDDFGCTHDQLAQRLGRSRPQISNTIRLLRLPPLVQRRVAAGVLSAGHARALLGLPDGAAMERLAQRVVAENLSVRATEEAVALGGDQAPAPVRTRSAAPVPAGFGDLAGRLSDRLDTRVRVAMGRRRGRLVVEFAGVEDLNRIIGALAPGDPGVQEGADEDAEPGTGLGADPGAGAGRR